MSKFWTAAFALLLSAGLLGAPAMAQSSDADDVGRIRRGGGDGGEASTKLSKSGLVWESDGFQVKMVTRVQFRLTYQNETAHGNDGQNGRDFVNFRVRRAKTAFSGHIFDKQFKYKATLSWASGANIVEEAFFTWALMKEFNVNAGQGKVAWNWEEMVSSGSQQFVDRGYVNEVFNQDFGKGIWLNGRVGDDVPFLKYWFGVYNGVVKGAADFRNADQPLRGDTFADGLVDAEMMINLRLETHPLGEVKGMNDSRGEDKHSDPIFAVGLGVNWMLGGFNNANLRPDTVGTPTGSGRFRTNQDTLAITLDGHFRIFGLSVDLAMFFRHTEFHNRGRNRYQPGTPTRNGIGNLDDFGFTFDISYFIIKQLNVGIRWNFLNADEFWMNGSTSRRFGVRPDANEIGLSVNYYVHGDNLKLTLDILYVSEQLPLNADADGAGGTQAVQGVYTSPPGRSAASIAGEVGDYADTWVLRLQLQWIW
jgi:hypothetical protein